MISGAELDISVFFLHQIIRQTWKRGGEQGGAGGRHRFNLCNRNHKL